MKLKEIVTSTVEIEESDDELPEPEKEEKKKDQDENDDLFQKLETLTQLRDEGIISEQEYQEKKATLLA